MVLNNTPNPVLKILATGNVLKNQFGHLIPQLAAYFLPVGKSKVITNSPRYVLNKPLNNWNLL